MASPIVEGAAFSEDILSFFRLLQRCRVRYLVVGGEAVIYHGYPRVTGDVDFFYENTRENAGRLFHALALFAGKTAANATAQRLGVSGAQARQELLQDRRD